MAGTTRGKTEETRDPKGRKAVAIVDADWITPVHNKQDFSDPDGAYRRAAAAAGSPPPHTRTPRLPATHPFPRHPPSIMGAAGCFRYLH